MDKFQMWKLNPYNYNPEKVNVYDVSGDFVIQEGEDHTTWKGNYFDSPADAFVAAFADCERSLRYAQEKKEALIRAHKRYLEQ